ncbi:MAG: hypothetical protein OEZ13_12805 [Spirochaetia bacterium]|nr:hypothetical protein [Spirochaetia bacterium]
MKKLIKRASIAVFFKISLFYLLLYSPYACFTEVGNPEPEYSVSGTAIKGPVSSGIVTIYSLQTDGSLGAEIDSAITDENGDFSFNYNEDYKNPVAVILTGGAFKDEATWNQVSFDVGENLRTYLPSLSEGQSISITALTEIAVSCALKKVQSGFTVNNALNHAYNDTAEKFGLSNITMIPENPFNGNLDSNRQSTRYALIQAGFSEYARLNGAHDAISVTKALSEDNEDCDFDGLNNGAAISFEGTGVSLSSDAYSNGIRNAINSYLSSGNNTTGVTSYTESGNGSGY